MLEIDFEKTLATTEGKRPLKVHFTVKQGEVTAIIGESGIGKTTILRVLAGLESVSRGKISWKGNQWLHANGKIMIPAEKRPVSMIFQDYALFPNMTVQENITFAQPKTARNAKEVEHWMHRFDLANLAGRLPARLSGGQKQRLAFARAIARKPEILLMDEPLSAFDQANRHALQSRFLEIQEELGLTALIVTHDRGEVQRLADQCINLSQNELEIQCVLKSDETVKSAQWIAEVIEINELNIKISIDNMASTIPFDERIPKGLKVGDQILMKWDGGVSILKNGLE